MKMNEGVAWDQKECIIMASWENRNKFLENFNISGKTVIDLVVETKISKNILNLKTILALIKKMLM